MKIRIHKGFRAVLSVFVAVMLLVEVMPIQVWQGIKAEAATFVTGTAYNIYFDQNKHDQNQHWEGQGDTIYLGYRFASSGSYTWVQMNKLGSTKYYEYILTGVPNKIKFSLLSEGSAGNDSNSWKTTVSIATSSTDDGILYYINGYVSENRRDKNFKTLGTDTSFSEPNVFDYSPIASTSFSSIRENTNLDVATNYSFETKSGRQYISSNIYDYFSDYEMLTGSRTGITTEYKWVDEHKHIPTLTFDWALSEKYKTYGTALQHPIYFGDLSFSDNGYDFETFNKVFLNSSQRLYVYNDNYAQFYHDNNSVRRSNAASGDADVAVQGLYGSTLSNGKLTLSNGEVAPFFDSSWLTTSNATHKHIGAVYNNVSFPFFTTSMQRTINGVAQTSTSYSYYNSSETSHALRLATYTENGSSKYFLKETNAGVMDSNGANGIFPFNNSDNNTINNSTLGFDKHNYCFGMELTIPFRLANTSGLDSNGAPITFTFSGDDDLLVYLDGNLILDIGGAHGKVEGEINFATKKSWVSKVKTPTGQSGSATWGGTGSVQTFDASGDAGTSFSYTTSEVGDHELKIFYMERGLFESNMSILYNLPVINDRVIEVEKQVSTNTLNPNMLSATNGSHITDNLKSLVFPVQTRVSVGNASSFGNPSDPTTYSYNGTAGTSFTSSNQMLLKDDDVATYTKVLSQTGYLEIQELGSSTLQYDNGTTNETITGKTISSLFDTSWQYYAVSGGNVSQSGSGTGPARDTNTGYFQWVGTDTQPSRVVFTNTLKTKDITITKQCVGLPDGVNSQSFDFTITLDNVGGIGLEESDFDGTSDGSDSTNVTITITKQLTFTSLNYSIPQTITISNVPVGTSYTISESVPSGYATPTFSGSIDSNGGNGTITNDNVSVTVTNATSTPSEQEPQAIILKIQKVWGTTTVYPAELKFKVKKSGNDAGVTTVLNYNGTDITSAAYDSTNHILTMTETNNATTVIVDGVTSTVWVAYIVDGSNTDIDGTGGSAVTYTITELGDSDAELANQGEWTYTTGEGDEAVTTTFKVHYSFSAAGGGSNTGTYSGQVTATPTNFITYESTYGDNTGHTLRILTLSAMNSVVPEQTQTNTGGRGGYIPIAGGFIAILLAGAGYFIYKKRIFA